MSQKVGTRSGPLFCSNEKKKVIFVSDVGEKKLFCFQRKKREVIPKKKKKSGGRVLDPCAIC